MSSAVKAEKQRTSERKMSSEPELALIRALVDILEDKQLAELEFTKNTLHIRLARGQAAAAKVSVSAATIEPDPKSPLVSSSPLADQAKPDLASHPGAIKSPMVGTVYIRPSPDAEPFVKVGDNVKAGDTLVLIEAMKTFNPVTAPKAGQVVEVLVADAQPIEFGESLVIIS